MTMSDETLSIAIDLGTTSAKIACCRFGSVELIPTREGATHTPCIVWLTPQGSFVVGRRAQQAHFRDPANVGADFVANLGTDAKYTFSRSNKCFNPAELTAEFLRSLRADAEQFVGREIRGAVITVPPEAGLARCQATTYAASLAGFAHCQLIQDATAAVLASAAVAGDCGHRTVLIYDFGGRGFSASLLYVRDGTFQVMAYAGDSLLGGASLDREVVERVLVPALQAAHPELDLSRNVPRAGQAYARLQAASEAARLRLSEVDKTLAFVPGLSDAEGRLPIDFQCELTRDTLERLAAPLVDHTISICDQVLRDCGIAASEVKNVIPVGGMVLMPFVRQRLKERFGEQTVVAGIDSATAVVQGAAIFAASQRLPLQISAAASALPMEEEVSPDVCVSACVSSPGLLQTIGIALHNNQVIRLFDRGTALPARRGVSLRTVTALRRGQSGDALKLPLVEGESDRADRNRGLGTLSIPLESVSRDVPAGTEVEVTIEIDDSREFKVSAYIPALDAEFEQRLALSSTTPSRPELSDRFDRIRARLSAVLESPETNERAATVRQARSVLEGDTCAEVEALLTSTETGGDAAVLCARRLDELQSLTDDVEDDLEWAVTLEVFKKHIRATRELLTKSRQITDEERTLFPALERMANDAIARQDTLRLRDCSDRLDSLCHSVALRDPGFWMACFEQMRDARSYLRDSRKADALLALGKRAIDDGDFVALEQAVRGLVVLLPSACSAAPANSSPLEVGSDRNLAEGTATSQSAKARPERRRAEVPTSRIDRVHFSVASPPTAQPGRKFIVDVWAHLEWQRAEVERRVQQARPQEDPAPVIRPKGPFKIERGTTLFVRLRFPDLLVDPPEDVILWEGEIGNASFEVAIPSEAAEGLQCGLVTVHWEGGFQIARVPLQILVATKAAPSALVTQPLHSIRKAFASYANPDRDEVLRAIQGMQKILPDLDVFLDVVKLRSGEDWEKRLWQVIPESDVFYLFWSAAAKASPWVEKEWRCALKSRGYEFIDPVPLVSPEEVRPPDELSKKHFNDWILAFRRGRPEARE
jgi:molecular chaperone DnaK (HSP70)